MNFRLTLTASAFLSVFLATGGIASGDVIPSADDEFVKWGEESGWTIYVNETRGSCLIERVDENQNVVQMGVTKDQEMGYLGVFTLGETGLKGDLEPIGLSLDGNVYSAKAHKKSKHLAEGYTGGYILASDSKFVDDVMKKYEMVVFTSEDSSFTVSLDGTLKAIEAARGCNAEQNS